MGDTKMRNLKNLKNGFLVALSMTIFSAGCAAEDLYAEDMGAVSGAASGPSVEPGPGDSEGPGAEEPGTPPSTPPGTPPGIETDPADEGEVAATDPAYDPNADTRYDEEPVFDEISAPPKLPKGDGMTQASYEAAAEAAAAAAGSGRFVGVPSNYVYNEKRGSLHDYCTWSPDQWWTPAGTAKFQGPCARHDLCYGGRTDKKKCDVWLRADMRTNCEYAFGRFNPLRYKCYDIANVYFAAVVIHS
jgi:hypothetical protein